MTTAYERFKNIFPGLDYDWLSGDTWQPLVSAPKTEILPRLWVGGLPASKALKASEGWTIICVREFNCKDEPWAIHIPLLRQEVGNRAGRKSLDAIADEIELALAAGDNVLVHCWEGVERGPLSVVYFLVTRRGYTFEEAYDKLKDLRPGVADRRAWLTKRAAKACGLPRGWARLPKPVRNNKGGNSYYAA